MDISVRTENSFAQGGAPFVLSSAAWGSRCSASESAAYSTRAAHQQHGWVCLHGVPSWRHSRTSSSALRPTASIVL